MGRWVGGSVGRWVDRYSLLVVNPAKTQRHEGAGSSKADPWGLFADFVCVLF